MTTALRENELWLLSFYRTSEIGGALFFGQLARALRPGPIQHDLTRHFADESQHAWLWTQCIERLGGEPLRLTQSYQDQYVAAAGVPANLMEVLAITQVFERRVIGQYARHADVPELAPQIRDTLARIMHDEKWHVRWVRDALKRMEGEYGRAHVRAKLAHYTEADREVYRNTMAEHAARVRDLMQFKSR